MFKKCLAALLALAVMISVLPAVPAQAAVLAQHKTNAANSAALVSKTNAADAVRQAAEQQVKAYAKSIAVKNSGDEAVEQLVRHAMFKNGKQLNAGEGAALTAALMNSGMMQACLAEAVANGVLLMHKLGRQTLCLTGAVHWYRHKCQYRLKACDDVRDAGMMWLLDAANCYDAACDEEIYRGALNTNDEALMLVVGNCNMEAELVRTRVTAASAVYRVRVTWQDEFDFNGSYKEIENSGYDTSAAEILTAWGKVLGSTVLDPFGWTAAVEFELEMPYACSHAGTVHRWRYDGQNGALCPEAVGAQMTDPTVLWTEQVEGKTQQYHETQNPVVLRHDRPWTVEYHTDGPGSVLLASGWQRCYQQPALYFGPDGVFLCISRNKKLTVEEVREIKKTAPWFTGVSYCMTEFFGVETEGLLDAGPCVVRLENQPGDTGNTVFLSAYDENGGQLLAPVPMTQYFRADNARDVRTEGGIPEQTVSGRDLVINFIGSREMPLEHTEAFTLTIWENGEGAEPESCFVTTYKAPTCTEPGGNVHTCTRCGYSEFLTVEPALGHSYGEYVPNDDAQCEQDTTKTAACTACGRTKTVTVPGTALEHQWKEATCDTLKHCTLCYKTVGSALGHSIEVIPEQPPTCTKMGFTAGEWCPVCGKTVTVRKVIKATGHKDADGDDRCDACALWMGAGKEPVPTPAPTPEEPARIPGDVNGDKEVNNKDATRLFQYLSGWDVEVVAEVLDMNGDGEVNNKDATRLFQYLSGWAVTIR